MKKTILLFVAVLFFVTLVFSQATTGKGQLRGLVIDKETGQPLEGVEVKLFSARAASLHTVIPKTNSEGKWRVRFVRGGPWNLDFEKIGYETQKISFFVDTTVGHKRPEIKIFLRKVHGPTLEKNVIDEIEKAKALMVEKNYDQALSELKTIVEKYKANPGINIVYLYIGNCYGAKSDFNNAIPAYKLALEKYPKHQGLIISIGNAYNNISNHDEAMKWFAKLSFDEIGNVDTLYNIGVNFYNSYKYAEAVKYFKKAVKIDPEFSLGFYQLGMTYTAQNKIPAAISALKRFIELDPDSPNAQSAQAIIDAFSN